MSEAKVEKIKVRICSFVTLVNSQHEGYTGGGPEDYGGHVHYRHGKALIIIMKGSSFATGIEVQDRRKRVLVISTGSKSVDTILGGE